MPYFGIWGAKMVMGRKSSRKLSVQFCAAHPRALPFRSVSAGVDPTLPGRAGVPSPWEHCFWSHCLGLGLGSVHCACDLGQIT